MTSISELYQTGDWKAEKHVPSINAPEKAEAGKDIRVEVFIGEEIAHPNTLEHHIAWITLFFIEDGAKFPVEIGKADFSAHGKAGEEGGVFTAPRAVFDFRAAKSGTIIATSYCNIHGLWENTKKIEVA